MYSLSVPSVTVIDAIKYVVEWSIPTNDFTMTSNFSPTMGFLHPFHTIFPGPDPQSSFFGSGIAIKLNWIPICDMNLFKFVSRISLSKRP